MNILVLLGTARKGRKSEFIAKFVFDILQEHKIDVTYVDINKFLYKHTIPTTDHTNDAVLWRKEAERADGFIIVTPEYNHGYPGELKILLDSALKEYAEKPVGIITVSNGAFGGVRGREALLPILSGLGMYVINYAIQVPDVDDFLEEYHDLSESPLKLRIEKMIPMLSNFILQRN
jgi:NAD(P)H-dependent FMN reductase